MTKDLGCSHAKLSITPRAGWRDNQRSRSILYLTPPGEEAGNCFPSALCLCGENPSYSFRSTCSTESTGWPKKFGPIRRNFSAESVAKKRKVGCPAGPCAELTQISAIFPDTACAVEFAESTMLTCAGATLRNRGLIKG